MSPTGRALSIVTGHPALKLVLLTVAACPGWPAAGDVAAGAELDPDWTADALTELVRLGHLTAHTADDATRYGLPDDGWSYTRDNAQGGPQADAPAAGDLAALENGDISGYRFGTAHTKAARA
jgi:hypothetical protein